MPALPIEITVNAAPVDVPLSAHAPIVCRLVRGPATTGTVALTVAAPGATLFETLDNNTLNMATPQGLLLSGGAVGTLRLTPSGLDGDAVVRVEDAVNGVQVA